MSKACIPFRKICQYCKKEFDAHTRITKYCSHQCNSRAYKQAKREKAHREVTEEEIVKSASLKTNILLEEIAETVRSIQMQLQVGMKPYLTMKEAGELLSMSRMALYRLTQSGQLPTYTIGKGRTYIKRSDIDRLFQSPNNHTA